MKPAVLLPLFLLVSLAAQAQQAPKPAVFSKFSEWTKGRIAAKSHTAFVSRSMTDGPAGAKEALQLAATPSTAITDETGVTYQGVHIAIVGADRAGAIKDVRAVREGFKTGERFKVRTVSTFAALVVIENINAKGERRQIYPADNAVVVLQPGADALLPLGEKEFFEFVRATGEEQLIVSLRDPRATADAASRQKVFRVDEDDGTFFVQEVADGTFPAIAEPIRLEHR